MICKHCGVAFHPLQVNSNIMDVGIENMVTRWELLAYQCPQCRKANVKVRKYLATRATTVFDVYPVGPTRQCPTEVPVPIATDFLEASQVLELSPKSSAALSRRCLQHLLADAGVSKQKDLSKAIDDALKQALPAELAHNLDSIRVVGNFAAHPGKSANSGEIIDVEQHEAEWTLDVLEQLFDYYYVQPARNAAKRAAINAKLTEAGRGELKTPLSKS